MAIKQLILVGFFGMFLINMTFCPNVIGAENNIEQSVNQNRLHPRIVQLEDVIGMTSPVKKRVEIVSPKSIFIDVTFSSGIKFEHTDGNSKLRLFNEFLGSGGGFFDYDNDGDLDIYLVNGAYQVGEEAGKSALNILYRNNGDGTFFDVTDTTNVGDTGYGVGCTIGDYDNDGNVDLYITNFGSNICYRNNGDGTFTDVSTQAGIANKQWGTSCAFVDLNNDGYKDIFVANGHVMDNINQVNKHVMFPQKNLLFRNLSDGTFRNISDHSGLALEKVSRAVAFGDYDNDGDIDILVTNWNQTPDLLRNDVGNQKNWIQINAVGIKSNRSAIGARAKIVAGNLIQYQEVNSSNGYLSFSDLRLHFGLGSFQRVDTLEIRWPSGRIDKSVNLEVNQRYIATEGIGVQVY